MNQQIKSEIKNRLNEIKDVIDAQLFAIDHDDEYPMQDDSKQIMDCAAWCAIIFDKMIHIIEDNKHDTNQNNT